MNKHKIAKELIKIAKEMIGKIDYDSQEWRRYAVFVQNSRRDFGDFDTAIHVYLDTRNDEYPVATLNLSATGGMSEGKLEKYLAVLDEAMSYIKGKEEQAIEMWERMHPETYDFE